MTIGFDHREFLWLLLLAGPVIGLGLRSLASLDRVRRWTAIGLRLSVLIVLVLMLAGLQSQRRHTDQTVIAVVDQSESVLRFAAPAPELMGPSPSADPPRLEQQIEQWIRQASARHFKVDDRFRYVTYDGQPTVRAMSDSGLEFEGGARVEPVEGTDTAAAIHWAMSLFSADRGRRIVLFSDGNDTGGDASLPAHQAVLEAALQAKAAGIPIDVVPLEYRLEHEVMVDGVYAPMEAREGQTVAVRVALRGTAPTGGLLYLKHNGEPLDLNGPAPGVAAEVTDSHWALAQSEAAGGRYECVRQLEIPMFVPGPSRFEVIFEPTAHSDSIVSNNHAETFTHIHGRGRVLFVDDLGAEPGRILPKALAAHGIELEVVSGSGYPADLVQLQQYDAVILQNVPSERLTKPQQQHLARYVHDLGGGLIMIGGPDSFGAGGWTNSAIDRILPVECRIPSQTVLPSGALVLVLDRSGSMASSVGGSQATQQEVANEAAVQALATLYPQDYVGVVAFDTQANWIVALQPNGDPSGIARRIRSIHPRGGTDIYPGLMEAYNALAPLRPEEAAVRHIILLTDGQSQSAQYHKIVGQMAMAGISLSTVGVGDAVNDSLLNQLAQMAGGTYYPVKDPRVLPQIFIKEARTIRKNLIKEVPFQPQLVQTGSPIMAGLSAVPELRGLVLTGPKHDARVFMPILGPEGEPVFAHWQVGLGRSAAFTSDASNRWAVAWLAWEGYADFWNRMVRTIARPSASRQFDLSAAVRGQHLRVRLDTAGNEAERLSPSAVPGAGPRGSFGTFARVQGGVLMPDGSVQAMELRQTGPGLYEADIPAPQSGNYLLTLAAVDDQGVRHTIFGGATRPPGAELRSFQSNLRLLEQVAAITGGRLLSLKDPQSAELFDRRLMTESRSIRPLWHLLLPWLIVLFLLDVAVRRIAWDAGDIRRWAVERAAALGRLMRGREVEATATLEALKRRASQVDEQLPRSHPTASGKAGSGADSPPLVAAPSTKRKFEASADAEADEDFIAAVGGAKPVAPRAARPSSEPEPSPKELTTSRLLAAKQRAKQQLDEPEN